MRDVPRVDNLQRVDRADYEFAMADGIIAQAQNMAEAFLLPTAGPKQFIIQGFALDNASATTARVRRDNGAQRGAAVLSFRENGVIKHGAVFADGEAQRVIDVSALADGTYGGWIRFEFQDAEFQNRVFWNPSTKTEFTQNVPTKRVANWSFRLAIASPGAEWFSLGTVDVTGGSITGLSQERDFYFEGAEDNNFLSTWGGGSDRSDDRFDQGVFDLRTAMQAIFKKLEEIQTGTNTVLGPNLRWWKTPAHGSLDDMVPLSGSVGASTQVRGNIEPDGNGTRTLGHLARAWNIVADRIDLNDVAPGGGIYPTISGVDMGAPAPANRFSQIYSEQFYSYDKYVAYGDIEMSSGVADFYPTINGANDIGKSATRFANIYAEAVDIAGQGLSPFVFTGTGDGVNTVLIGDDTANMMNHWITHAGAPFTEYARIGYRPSDNEAFLYTNLRWNMSAAGTLIYLESGKFAPASPGIVSLGDPVNYWGNFFVENAFVKNSGFIDLSQSANPVNGTLGVKNKLYRKNLPAAWLARRDTTPAGGVGWSEGHNLAYLSSGAGATYALNCVFADAMADTNYFVHAQAVSSNGFKYELVVEYGSRLTGGFTLRFKSDTGGSSNIQPAVNFEIDILVFGNQ